MFKFNFDVESGEVQKEEKQNTVALAGDRGQESSANIHVEPFREVFPAEVADLEDIINDRNVSVIETLGVKHLSEPVTKEKDTVLEQTDKCHSDLIPWVCI